MSRRIASLAAPKTLGGNPAFATRLSKGLSALVASTFLVIGCVRDRSHATPQQVAHDFGDMHAPLPDAAIFMSRARDIVGHKSSPTPAPVSAPGRRVILTLFRPGHDCLVETAVGSTQADALEAAAIAIAGKAAPAGDGRLELDVPTAIEETSLDQDIRAPLTAIGLQGVLVAGDDGKTGAVVPAEIVERGMFQLGKTPMLDRDKIGALLAARAGVRVADLASMRAYLFRADVHVEAPRDETPRAPLAVVRGMVVHPSAVAPARLLQAVRRGADYLVRILGPEGRYLYSYHPVDDRADTQYGWLRHAGTTYALLEAYGELRTKAYLDMAERALSYLKAHLRSDPESQGKFALDTNDEEQQKVGGAGLALLAFAEDAKVSGRRGELETMRDLARFILKQEYEDGHFRGNADLERETGEKRKREPVYYPGEAVLGLMRLYAIDPQSAYLDAAKRAADWVVQVRDANVSEDEQEHDHWMAYALNELYRVSPNPDYLDHAYKIARAIRKKQHRGVNPPAPDWPGTFYEGQTTPASTRLEAYDAVIALSRFAGAGGSPRSAAPAASELVADQWLLEPAREVACSMLGQQYDDDDDYWLANPARADGGVRESLFVHDVRIDYVQHAMSAWLHLARILRDPSYGRTGVPSQDPGDVVPGPLL
jgi:hypothetical protein